MSAMTARTVSTARRLPVRALPQGARPTAATALRLVPQRRSSAPRAPFITMVVLLLAGGLLGLLALNTVLAEGAFRVHTLKAETKALADQEQTLEREVETLRTPRNLAERASELGMVQGSTPAFLRLSDGAVLGAEVPAGEDLPEGEAGVADDNADDSADDSAADDTTDDDATDDDAESATDDDTETSEDP